MIQLKVTFFGVKEPKKVVKILREIVKGVQYDDNFFKVIPATDGNTLGYGLIKISHTELIETPQKRDYETYVAISLDTLSLLQSSHDVKNVQLFLADNEETDMLKYDSNIVRGRTIEDYIIIKRKDDEKLL